MHASDGALWLRQKDLCAEPHLCLSPELLALGAESADVGQHRAPGVGQLRALLRA